MSDIAEFNSGKGAAAKKLAKSGSNQRLKVAARSSTPEPLLAEADLLRLSQLWQTTLDVYALLDRLIGELPRFVPFDSFSYYHPEQALEQRVGQGGKHSCSYKLNLQGRQLGQLEMTRSKRFSEAELTTIERILGTFINSLRNAVDYHQMARSAYTDSLTGLLNRNALSHLLGKEIKRAQRSNEPLSLLFIDLDHFKSINDQYGHSSGDRLLRQLALLLESQVRGSDCIYRYGGEEFIVQLPDTSAEGARLVAEKILAGIGNLHFAPCGKALPVTASIGATTLNNEDAHSLIERADRAMYRAKEEGRNRICVL
ncbi:GGDEF domain-containing protein [Porticoccus sp. W117]|uniref:GGDEF domain-containing protein n=1 Tax=Porticoccus sp. W117 TaxID=3054777 RepID=UPI0025972AD4|nr:GGDEF domain-containing protein [Porticoccus sp. W117]MDM3869878.1 GGDEF domain-containing protein [Porticoccus sp. W117]